MILGSRESTGQQSMHALGYLRKSNDPGERTWTSMIGRPSTMVNEDMKCLLIPEFLLSQDHKAKRNSAHK